MKNTKGYFLLVVIGIIMFGGLTVMAAVYKELTAIQIIVLLITYTAITFAAIYDYRLMQIPNLVPLALFTVRAALFGIEFAIEGSVPIALISSALGCLLSGAILLTASKLSHGGVGAGDVKLFAAIGFACGFEMTFSVLLTALIFCAAAGGIMVTLKKKTAKDALPFAPFIWCGFVLTMFISML